MKLFRILFFVLLCSGWIHGAAASDTRSLEQTVLAGLENQYAGRSFSAEFKQTSVLSALDISETASGKAWFSHPGKMKWQYLAPERHDIITNGQTLWIFRPDENQVMIGDAAPFFASGAGGAFLSDISQIRDNFSVSVAETTDQWVALQLEAPPGNTDIQSIRIQVSRTDFQIQTVTTVNNVKDITRFELSDIQFQDMPDNWFEFEIPSGTHIIDMN
ncbi:MAG: outer membrane lipoprotein carrier protein LolA [Desulfotignum sp.]|nr:outer membrane lipoprotein carrier protein LolA [Desulfotignum sp.]MCF8136136.1 outer membrane lipoprotein carrier protein LolA [Desulfotignum sp.]